MATESRVRTARLGAAGVAFAALVALAAFMLAPAARSATTGPVATTRAVEHVHRTGTFAVIVTIEPPTASEVVSVYAGSQVDPNVQVYANTPVPIAFELRLRRKRFVVRAVSSGAAARFTVATARQAPATAAVGSGAVGHTLAGSSGVTGASGATGATGASGPVESTTTIVSPPSGSYKHLAWSDEFTGPAGTPPNPANWSLDSYGGCGDGTLSSNTASTANAALDGDGHLSITADGPPGYESAQIDSAEQFSFEYGELEARIKIPAGSGLCSAFWMLGDSTAPGSCWPQCGEIDVMEAISPYPNYVYATIHGPVSGSSNFQQWQAQLTSPTPFTAGYHTYGVIWRPGLITWTFDGVPYATATPSQLPPGAQWVFDGHPFHLVLDLAVGGWPGAPAAGAPFPATLSVDWVRLYN
jgi:beta-glucanase (GH16 family)